MRSFALVVVIILSLSMKGWAQRFENIGLKAGVTLTKLTWELKENSMFPSQKFVTRRTPGYYFMISGDWNIMPKLNVQPSLGILQKRGVYENEYFFQSSRTTGRATYETTYLSASALARLQLLQTKRLAIRFHLGPRVDYLAGYSDSIERFYLPGSWYLYWADDDDLQNFVFGVTCGFSLEYEMKRSAIGIEVSRAFSLNPAFDARGPRRDAYGDHGFYMKLRDNVFVVSLIYVRKKKSSD